MAYLHCLVSPAAADEAALCEPRLIAMESEAREEQSRSRKSKRRGLMREAQRWKHTAGGELRVERLNPFSLDAG